MPSHRFRAHFTFGLALLLVSVLGACAGPRQTLPIGEGTEARSDAGTPAGEPDALEGAAPDEASQASRSPSSLDLAREILEQEGGEKLDADQREAIARALVRAEAEDGFSVLLALAIIKQESRFDPAAQGPAGSIGLMQLQPATARELAQRHGLEWDTQRTLLDPRQNVRLGLTYLGEMRNKFGSTERAIAAYNIGPGNLRRLLARRPLQRGPYLTKVYGHAEALRLQYGP